MELITIVHSRKTAYIPMIYHFFTQTTQHYLVYDQADRNYAIELQSAIEQLNKHKNYNSKILLIEVDEDCKSDMQRITQRFTKICDEVYLNGGCGDLAIVIVLSNTILTHHGHVIAYDIEDNSYNLISQKGFTHIKTENTMSIYEFLLLMGDTIVEERSKIDIESNEEALNIVFDDMKMMFKVRNLLRNSEYKNLSKSYPKQIKALQKLGVVDENFFLKGQEGFSSFGYLFEQFVYLRLKCFDFDDIKVGVKIRFDQKQAEREKIEVINEFDILVIKNNKIGFIECKIGDPSDPLNTVYKSDSVMEYFGDTARSLILNIEKDKTPQEKESKKNFSDPLVYRAETKNVTIHNAFDLGKHIFHQKIEETFGVKCHEADQKEQQQ